MLCYETIIDAYYTLPAEERDTAVWRATSKTVKQVEKIRDDADVPLWRPSLFPGDPDRLLGRPFVVDDALPEDELYFG